MYRVMKLVFVIVAALLIGGCAHHHFNGNGHHLKSVYTDCSAPHVGTCVSMCNKANCSPNTVTVLPPVYQAVPTSQPCTAPCGMALPPVYQPVATQSPCTQPCGYVNPTHNPCAPQCGYMHKAPSSIPCTAPCGAYVQPQVQCHAGGCAYPQVQMQPMPQAQPNPTSMVYPIEMSNSQTPGSTGIKTYLYRPANGVVYQY